MICRRDIFSAEHRQLSSPPLLAEPFLPYSCQLSPAAISDCHFAEIAAAFYFERQLYDFSFRFDFAALIQLSAAAFRLFQPLF